WPALNATVENCGRAKGLTVTTKLWVALRLGVPLSATMTVNGLVEFACVTNGRHVSTPLLAAIIALVGAVSRLKVSVCAGTSVSVAELMMLNVTPAPIVRLVMVASVGGAFSAP